MHKMFNLTRQPSKGKRPHLKVMSLPGACLKTCCIVAAKVAAKTEVCGSSKWLHSIEMDSTGFTRDRRSSGTLKKWCRTERLTVSLYLDELLN